MSDRAENAVLSAHVREEIDHWVAKFPAREAALGRHRRAARAQHENGGYLTPELMTPSRST